VLVERVAATAETDGRSGPTEAAVKADAVGIIQSAVMSQRKTKDQQEEE